ncbi:MAG TPA: M3 family oligoendopeptidase, partial [Ruminococcaceae bacterium]|nr:M3 family oligoendopeptidase [Oscillospiraceae bacterium]
MKFSEFSYKRPDLAFAMAQMDTLAHSIQNAQTVSDAKSAFLSFEKMAEEIRSLSSICYVRHTVDTRDRFYEQENAFWDENLPLFMDKQLDIYRAMLASPLRPALEKEFGRLLFDKMEIDVKSADPSIIPLMQEENSLQTQYQQLYASAKIPFDGKTLTVAQLAPYKQNPDRSV